MGGVAFVRNDNDGKYYFPTTENVAMGAAAGLERYTKKYGAKPAPDADWNPVSIEFTNPPRGYPIWLCPSGRGGGHFSLGRCFFMR